MNGVAISAGNKWESPPTVVPGVPQNLVAVGGSQQVTLTWGALPARPRIRAYVIKRAEASGDEVPVGVSSNSSFVDTGLEDETEYFYTVSAVNHAGESADSDEASATTDAAAVSVLLQDLVAAWELTIGPQDSGPNGLDLTEIGAGLTYGSNGVQGNGVAYLSHSNNALFDAGMDKDFFICVSFKTPSNEGVLVGKTQNGEAPFYDEYCVSFDGLGRFRCYMYNDTVNAGAAPSVDTFHVGFAWFNHTTGALSVQVDDGLPVSSVIGGNPSNNSSPFTLLATDDGNSGYAGIIRNIVLWVGDDLSEQYKTESRIFLYNAGASRTFAELGDYTE